MRCMSLRATYQKPRTTVPEIPAHLFLYLMDLRDFTGVDQASAGEMPYIPLQKGFLYLVAVMDLFSRHMLS